MSRADELRLLADQYETQDAIVAAYQSALAAYRADPNESTREAYKDAAVALADARARLRDTEGRAIMTIAGDAFVDEED